MLLVQVQELQQRVDQLQLSEAAAKQEAGGLQVLKPHLCTACC